ncbi:Ferritin-like diiron domain-containing protein [Gammaproteobacteria bacterium]
MADIKDELITMLNQALRLEHAARIQYLAQAELIKGLNAEPVIARLKEIAGDEAKHEDKFRTLIASYLGGEPTMEMAPTHKANTTEAILKVNLQDEKAAIDFYKQIHAKIMANKESFPYCFDTLEHEVRHIFLEEQEHVTELSTLLGL